jgi:hypothetical protein
MENRPATGRIGESDFAAKPCDDLLDDTQPETDAPLVRASELSAWPNFSNTRPLNASGMPGPWSRTETGIFRPRCSIPTTTSPPGRENAIAFESRLLTAFEQPIGVATHFAGIRDEV